MGTELIIETSNLTKQYEEVTALRRLSLEVPKNAIFGFLGPNGAGKSTAMKLLLGLAQPTEGSGVIFGMDIVRDSLAIRQRAGYLAQNPQFYEYMSARETLHFTGRFFGMDKQTIRRRTEEVLELVDLSNNADRPIKGFSAGERQRLGLAQAQINEPDLLILDEPAAALDPMGRRDVLKVMERLRERATIFYSTHILDDVQRVSDIVAILNHGELVAQAPIEQLLAGNGAVSYTVSFVGEPNGAHALLAGQPWVTGITAVHKNGVETWRVDVSDEQAAEAQLLATLVSSGVTIKEFGKARHNLEDVFINLVEG